ncbi:MAG: hypothetical protein Q7P63_07310 [Verrucomicrobiota bacterium JB022]|nr:hypothetical protein [Verrucomicrobiota bacterium JB022]
MKKTSVILPLVSLIAGSQIIASPFVIYDVPDITTVPSTLTPNSANSSFYDNNGIWLTMTVPTVTVISDGSYPGGPDGTFQLNTSDFYLDRSALIYTQGLFSNGNDVAVAGVGSQSNAPARFSFGDTIDSSSLFTGGFNYLELAGGPGDSYGNWNGYGRGAIGVSFPIAGEIHYGFIDITMNPDETITLHGYAYNSVAGEGIQAFVIPESSTVSMMAGLSVAMGVFFVRRRRA